MITLAKYVCVQTLLAGHTPAGASMSQDADVGGGQRIGENNNSQSDGERNYYKINKDFLDNN